MRNTLTCLKLVNPVLLEKGVMIPIACKDLNLYFITIINDDGVM